MMNTNMKLLQNCYRPIICYIEEVIMLLIACDGSLNIYVVIIQLRVTNCNIEKGGIRNMDLVKFLPHEQ